MLIDVWADIACPWCWIGETRLYRALEERPEVEATVAWRPFQLQPDLPREGMPWDAFVRARFGGPERARPMFSHVARAGEADGLNFDFDATAVAPNTRQAHRLVLHAQGLGVGRGMAEALFAAYFGEGRDVTRTGVLADVAAGVGLDRERVARFLVGDEHGADVDRSQAEARAGGITGVPYFVIDGKWAFSGAQPLETFVSVLDRVRGVDSAAD